MNNANIDAFYAKEFYFSYSSINKLKYSPALFYDWYVMNNKKDRLESYLVNGKVTHALLLENKLFDDNFIVSDIALPGENVRKVIDKIVYSGLERRASLNDYESEILSILKDINLHQKLKTDKQRVEKIVSDDTESYYKFMISKGDKTVIDKDTYDECSQAVAVIKENKYVKDLMCLDSTLDIIEVFNEYYIENKEGGKYGIFLKGFLDNVVINHMTKKIYINDLKKTSDVLNKFRDSVDYYRYDIQASIYYTLVQRKYIDLVKKGYTIEFRFVVVDKYNLIYPFKVNEDTMNMWVKILLEDILKEVNYHYTHRDYSLPYQFIANIVEL